MELARQGHEVYGFQRRVPESATATGIRPVTGDITNPKDLERLPGPFDWVINTISAGRGGEEAYRQVYLEGTRNLIEAFRSRPPARYVYTSSTGVYGQQEGEPVDETSPAIPENETSRILLETEQMLWQAFQASGFPAIILRVSGIYGPTRGYWLRQFLGGQAVMDGDGSRYLNMVHQEDVVGAIQAALRPGRPGQIYNVTDNEPVTQRRMFEWLASQLNRPMPPSQPVPPPRKRAASSKRVVNEKLRRELAYEFKYPTFREGFLKEMGGNGL